MSRVRGLMRRSWILLLLSILAGCAPADDDVEGRDLEYRLELQLGSTSGGGELPGRPTDLVHRPDGSWIVFAGFGMPQRFDSTGQYLGEIGRSGEGPGEYAAAMVGTGLPGDSLLILDVRLARASVLGPDLEFARAVSWPGQVGRVEPVAWPDTVLAVLWPRGLPGASHRVGSFAGPAFTEYAMFGDPWPERDFDRTIRFRRFASRPQEGELWTAAGDAYRLRRWSLTGDSLGSLGIRSRLFDREGMGFGPDSIPQTAIVAIQELTGDSLLIGLSVAHEAWHEAWEGVKSSGPEMRGPPETDLWEGVVEIRDGESGTLIGSQRLDGVIVEIFPDGRVATYDEVGAGFPVVRIYSREAS